MNDKFQVLADFATEGLIYQNADGKIEYWNRMAKEILGLEEGHLQGKPPAEQSWEMVFEDLTPCPRDQYPANLSLASGKPLEGEIRGIRRADSTLVWIIINTTPLFEGEDGKPTAVAISFREITERRKRETALARSEERYRLLAENAFDVIFLSDYNLKMTYVSPSVERILGYTPEEMIQLKAEDYITPASRSPIQEALKRRHEAESRGRGNDESRAWTLEFIRQDGVLIWVEVVTTPVRAKDGDFKGFSGVIRDISDRVRAQRRLSQSETIFRELFDNMSNGVAIYEAVDDGADFIFKDLNQAGLEQGRKTKEEITGKSVKEVFPGVVDLGLFDVFQRVWETGRPENHPSSMYNDGQLTLWVENYVFKLPSGEVVAVYDDTTRRMQAELALRDSEEKFRSISEQMAEAVFLTDGKGLISYMSPVAKEIFGHSAEEMVGEHFMNFLDPGSVPTAVEAFGRTIAKSLPVRNLGLGMKHKDGTVFFGELTGSPYHRQGRVVGSIGVIRDVTEQKEAQEALHLSQEKFSRAFQRSPVWVVLSTLKEGRYIEVNDFFLELTGFARKDVIGKTSLELNTWASSETRDKVVERIRADGAVREMEVVRLNSRGEPLNMLFSSEIITVGQEEYLLSVSQDITERKRMEEALRSSQEQFSLFTQQVPGLVYIKDDQSRYLFMNDQCAEFFGLPVDEIIGKLPQELFSPEKAELYLRTDQKILEFGRPMSLTEELKGSDGQTRIMLNHKFLIERTSQPPLIAGFYLDMTDRVRAEEALRVSEEMLRSIFRAAPVGIGLMVDRVFKDVNDKFCEMTGYPKDELVGQSAGLIYLSGEEFDRVGVDKYLQIKEHGVGTVETKFKRKNGETIDILLSSAPVDPADLTSGVTFTALDISDRKKARRDLNEAHQRLLTILGGVDSHIYVADMDTHEVLFMNKNMKESFGADLTGQVCYQAFRDQTEPCAHCTNEELIEHRDDPAKVMVWEGQNPVTKRWYINYDRAIEWVDGRLVRLQIATDISDLKRAEEEKANLEGQLRQAQKMEAIGTLAGGIAHDFNNLLTAILGYSELALGDAGEGVSGAHHIQEIIKAGNRAKDLVTQILAFSRKLEPELKPVDLNRVVEQSHKMLERTIPRMIRIETHLADDLWLVNADSNQLSQVLLNLGTNAKDAMPDGGLLVLETENVTLDEEYCRQHAYADPGDYVLLTTSDTGHGMDRETVEHIFDPFFTRKEVGKGTGLGLATAYGVIKNHGGNIICYSEVGQGTTFKIYLPALASAPLERALEEEEQEPPDGWETILLVDDEEPIRDLGRQILGRKGYRIILARTGEEALEVYQARSREIDLVILDISMPGMGGHKCLQALLEMDPVIKVIIASGYSLNGQLKDIITSGAAGFVAKPFLSKDLLFSIRAVLDG